MTGKDAQDLTTFGSIPSAHPLDKKCPWVMGRRGVRPEVLGSVQVLQDPKQKRFFKSKDMQDLFLSVGDGWDGARY